MGPFSREERGEDRSVGEGEIGKGGTDRVLVKDQPIGREGRSEEGVRSAGCFEKKCAWLERRSSWIRNQNNRIIEVERQEGGGGG